MKFKKLSPSLTDYLAAVSNEIAIEGRAYSMLNSSPDHLGYIPRVPRWISLGLKYPFLTNLLSKIVSFFWIAGGASLVFGIQAFVTVCRSYWRRKFSKTVACNDYVLAFSTRTGDIGLAKDAGSDANWIIFPWAPIADRGQNASQIDYAELLSVSDVFFAYINALKAVYLIARRPRQKKWILQSYTAFRWFSVRTVVENLRGPVLMTEHYDRWAVLVDGVFWRRAKRPGETLTLVQHGLVGSIYKASSPGASDLRLPRKLRAVDKLWVYDEPSERIFCDDILSRLCVNHAIVNRFMSVISTSDLGDDDQLRVLFVGHPLCEQAHQSLFRKMDGVQLKAYYKPHPRAEMSAQAKIAGWTLIEDPNVFPAVDLLISYPSTLTMEYGNLAVPSLVHPMNIAADEIDEFYRLVMEAVDRKKLSEGIRVIADI